MDRLSFPYHRLLGKEPSKKNHHYQYGFDDYERIHVVRKWFDLYSKNACYEEFYVYFENRVERFYFGYSSEKQLIRMSEFTFTELDVYLKCFLITTMELLSKQNSSTWVTN
jgi:hypothetical protein